MPLSILQISDLHAEPKGVLAYGAADTASRTKEIRPWLRSMSEKVDLIVVTGDIACDGNPEAYEIVRRTLEGLAAPVAVLPGNHDRRSTMRRSASTAAFTRRTSDITTRTRFSTCDSGTVKYTSSMRYTSTRRTRRRL